MASALSARGGSHAWSMLRKQWATRLPLDCSVCGHPVQPWQPWHLDHVIPRKHGGNDSTVWPAHQLCNLQKGDRVFSADDAPDEPCRVGESLPDRSPHGGSTPGPGDPSWNAATWLDQLRDVPRDASWPRLMTAPHPLAVGSYGQELCDYARHRSGQPLWWWQQLVSMRLLEHDADGRLLWASLLLSMTRQVGKSWWLRELCMWRIHQAQRYGETQLVLYTGKDISVCKEVQRPARAWAHGNAHAGYRVRETNGQEEISTPDDSRWMLRAKDSVYGYSASLAAVDEAWHVSAAAVEDGLEPTMAEREQPQLVLVSTAHRKATGLMLARRADAMEQLASPAEVLLVEWSAPADADMDDPQAWRAASPRWTDRRQGIVARNLARALSGHSDDPDEDDPLESFRAQWLNVWPAQVAGVGMRDEFLLSEQEWSAVVDLQAAPPEGPVVLAIEDWFGRGAAAAAAVRLQDGRLLVWGEAFPRRSDALEWVTRAAVRHPESRLMVGASLDGAEELAALSVASIASAGNAQTRLALPMLRELVAAGLLIHDGSTDLAAQAMQLRVTHGATGLNVSPRSGRSDLIRAASWAALEARRQIVPVEEPAIY